MFGLVTQQTLPGFELRLCYLKAMTLGMFLNFSEFQFPHL